MSTVRTAVKAALRLLKTIALGDDPSADELALGLAVSQSLILDLHNARGPLYDIDVAGAYTAGEDQRVRIENGDTVSITLPNSVSMFWGYDPYDYGFVPGYPGSPPSGSTGPADGIEWRAPYDGARIELVGTTQALFFYRADINAWQAATGLTIDSELPFNARLSSAFEALLAERMADEVADQPPSPMLAKRIARSRAQMLLQSGRVRESRVGSYL